MHWDGHEWSLTLRAPAHSVLRKLAVGADGEVWVAGNRSGSSATYPIVWHGVVAAGWTSVPVRHSPSFSGPIDALSVSSKGVVIAGQLSDPHVSPPATTYALRLGDDGTWRKEPTLPNGSGYARVHAAAVEPSGTEWLGGTAVGGTRLDPQSLLLRR